MPKLRILSTRQVLKILGLTIPNHDERDRGTLHPIYRQASRFIAESEIRPQFFGD